MCASASIIHHQRVLSSPPSYSNAQFVPLICTQHQFGCGTTLTNIGTPKHPPIFALHVECVARSDSLIRSSSRTCCVLIEHSSGKLIIWDTCGSCYPMWPAVVLTKKGTWSLDQPNIQRRLDQHNVQQSNSTTMEGWVIHVLSTGQSCRLVSGDPSVSWSERS